MECLVEKLTYVHTQAGLGQKAVQGMQHSLPGQENDKQDNSIAIKTGYLKRLMWWQW